MPSSTSILKRVTPISAPHLLTDTDLSSGELRALLQLASEVKKSPVDYQRALAGYCIALLFEKPSLRTRMTFQLAIKQLGGDAIFQDHCDDRIGNREPVRDMARNLSRWIQAVVVRTFTQKTIEDLARWSSVPVINALSDKFHPCQALADFQTLVERFGELNGLKMTFVGDGNNVCHSLMLCASRLGISISVATPRGYEPDAAIIAKAREFAEVTGAVVTITNDPVEAVKGVSAVYTDMWTSMGWEAETQQRRIAFMAYQVTDGLMKQAASDAVFMHCLPALRGKEVTDSVIESKASVVFDQAENRLHAQKALLLMLIGARGEEGE